MATEVSCGQCHGRLLVETLGVVVACPHCGTHLSIPAPEPEPAPAPAAPPAASPEPAPEIRFEIPRTVDAAISPEITVVADQINAMPDAPVFSVAAASGPTSDSLHDGADESQAVPTSVGWHSAPNLYLTPEVAGSSTAISQPPVVFSSVPPEEPAPVSQQPVTFAASAETTPASEPVWNVATNASLPDGAPAPTTAFVPQDAISPVTIAAEPGVQPDLPAISEIQFAAAPTTNQETVVMASPEPAPPVPSAPPTVFQQPLTFGAAPTGATTAPVTFGAAPATAPVSPSPVTFGAAPAPTALPTFNAAPATASTAPLLPTSTVAGDAAAFAENEAESQLKFLWMLVIIVGSYASAVTLVLAYMLVFGRTSALESLPDLKPPMNKNGDISWQYNPPVNNVAPGHVLSLGQSRRFGNVKVTPLKVTRGPVKFEHYAGQPGAARLPSEPVLKLWVKFENVSRNQTFSPLDPQLLFTRDVRNLGESIRANGFVTTEADRKKGKPLFYFFDIPVLSEFRIIGQNLNRDLAPGDTVESFVPSEEDALNLKGDLVWRFQFRKGYHPKSMRGVTTLIDVRFNSKDIVDERA